MRRGIETRLGSALTTLLPKLEIDGRPISRLLTHSELERIGCFEHYVMLYLLKNSRSTSSYRATTEWFNPFWLGTPLVLIFF